MVNCRGIFAQETQLINPIYSVTERNLHKITEAGAPSIRCALFPQQTDSLNWSRRKNSAFII